MVQQELARRRAAQSALQRSRTSSYRVAQPPSSSVTVSNAFTGKCIGVSDGDTITVLHNNTPVKVRLYGVDAPESKQAFGTRAKQFTAQLAFGKPVTVYGKGTDRYGRVLGWVCVGRTGVNSELVRNGYAWWYRQYSPRETRLQQMEAQAKQARRGLWSDAAAVAPWEFRRRR
jgi:endonuclease YncB( thermonuclease family)